MGHAEMSQQVGADKPTRRLIKSLAKIDDLVLEATGDAVWWYTNQNLFNKKVLRKVVTEENMEQLKTHNAGLYVEASEEEMVFFLTEQLPAIQNLLDEIVKFLIVIHQENASDAQKQWRDWYRCLEKAQEDATRAILLCPAATSREDIAANLAEKFHALDRIMDCISYDSRKFGLELQKTLSRQQYGPFQVTTTEFQKKHHKRATCFGFIIIIIILLFFAMISSKLFSYIVR